MDRVPLPVRVEGKAQGIAAPQHQLADLVDVDVKFESTTKTTGFKFKTLSQTDHHTISTLKGSIYCYQRLLNF